MTTPHSVVWSGLQILLHSDAEPVEFPNVCPSAMNVSRYCLIEKQINFLHETNYEFRSLILNFYENLFLFYRTIGHIMLATTSTCSKVKQVGPVIVVTHRL